MVEGPWLCHGHVRILQVFETDIRHDNFRGGLSLRSHTWTRQQATRATAGSHAERNEKVRALGWGQGVRVMERACEVVRSCGREGGRSEGASAGKRERDPFPSPSMDNGMTHSTASTPTAAAAVKISTGGVQQRGQQFVRHHGEHRKYFLGLPSVLRRCCVQH